VRVSAERAPECGGVGGKRRQATLTLDALVVAERLVLRQQRAERGRVDERVVGAAGSQHQLLVGVEAVAHVHGAVERLSPPVQTLVQVSKGPVVQVGVRHVLQTGFYVMA